MSARRPVWMVVGALIVATLVSAGCGGDGGSADAPGGGTADAAGADAGGAVPRTWCGNAQRPCEVPGDHCCGGPLEAGGEEFVCEPAATTCTTSYDLFCDGPEDCPVAQACCGEVPSGGFVSRCRSTCEGSEYVVCAVPTDCPGATPICCPLFHATTQLEFGLCVADDSVAVCNP